MKKDAGLRLSVSQASNRFGILALACDVGACLPRAGSAKATDVVMHARPGASAVDAMGLTSGQPKQARLVDFDAC